MHSSRSMKPNAIDLKSCISWCSSPPDPIRTRENEEAVEHTQRFQARVLTDESEEEFKECEIKAEPSASQKPHSRSKTSTWFKNSPTATHGSQAVTGWQDDWFRSSHDYSQGAELESLEASTVVQGSRIQERACSIDGTTDGINHVMMCAQGSDLPCSSVFRTMIRDRHGRPVASCVVAAQVMVNL